MNYIINPVTNKKTFIYSIEGNNLLKQYIRQYKLGGNKKNINITSVTSDAIKEISKRVKNML